jgi:hypothetical protein
VVSTIVSIPVFVQTIYIRFTSSWRVACCFSIWRCCTDCTFGTGTLRPISVVVATVVSKSCWCTTTKITVIETDSIITYSFLDWPRSCRTRVFWCCGYLYLYSQSVASITIPCATNHTCCQSTVRSPTCPVVWKKTYFYVVETSHSVARHRKRVPTGECACSRQRPAWVLPHPLYCCSWSGRLTTLQCHFRFKLNS